MMLCYTEILSPFVAHSFNKFYLALCAAYCDLGMFLLSNIGMIVLGMKLSGRALAQHDQGPDFNL